MKSVFQGEKIMGQNNLKTSVSPVTIGFFSQQFDQITELYFKKSVLNFRCFIKNNNLPFCLHHPAFSL